MCVVDKIGGMANIYRHTSIVSRIINMQILLGIILFIVLPFVFIGKFLNYLSDIERQNLESEIFKKLDFSSWDDIPYIDEYISVKSRQSLEKYDVIKFFKDHRDQLD